MEIQVHTTVSLQRVIRLLVWIVVGLVVLHLVGRMLGHWSWQARRILDLGQESNIPTWFTSLLFGAGALVAYDCSRLVRRGGQRLGWRAIALGLVGLSIDEVSMLHEHLGPALSPALKARFAATGWPVALAPAVLVGIILGIVVVWRCLPSASEARQRIGWGAAMLVAGAWGLELTTNFLNWGTLAWLWEMEIIAEESLEMLGMIVVLSGLLVWRQELLKTHHMPRA